MQLFSYPGKSIPAATPESWEYDPRVLLAIFAGGLGVVVVLGFFIVNCCCGRHRNEQVLDDVAVQPGRDDGLIDLAAPDREQRDVRIAIMGMP